MNTHGLIWVWRLFVFGWLTILTLEALRQQAVDTKTVDVLEILMERIEP